MENRNNLILKGNLRHILRLFLLFYVVRLTAMEPEGNYVSVCQEGTPHCTWIKGEVLMLSDTIKNAFEDVGSVRQKTISIPYDIKDIKFVFDMANKCAEIDEKEGGSRYFLCEQLTKKSLPELIDICNCAFYLDFPSCVTIGVFSPVNAYDQQGINIFSESLLLKIFRLMQEMRDLKEGLRFALANGFEKTPQGRKTPFLNYLASLQAYEGKFNLLPDFSVLNRVDQDVLMYGRSNSYDGIFRSSDSPQPLTNISELIGYLNGKKSELRNLIDQIKNK